MVKTFMRRCVGIEHTTTGGKFFSKGYEKNRSCINESDTGKPSNTQ